MHKFLCEQVFSILMGMSLGVKKPLLRISAAILVGILKHYGTLTQRIVRIGSWMAKERHREFNYFGSGHTATG